MKGIADPGKELSFYDLVEYVKFFLLLGRQAESL